jgi:hypothetical protein
VSICAAEWGNYQSGARCLDGHHVVLSGTSMATPHIGGVAILLRQAHPEWTPDQVKTLIVSSAHDLGLDPTVQGAGMVDARDAIVLGGAPSQIARVVGTPLRDVDVPTSRFGTFTSNLSITNTTSGDLTFTASFTGSAGLSVTFDPPSVTLAAGQTGTIAVTRQVDHDVVPSGAVASGTITLGSAQGNLAVGVQVGVRDRLTAAPSPLDLGVDLPTQASWTAQATIQITNLRTDAAQTLTAAVTCCATGGQAAGSAIVASVDQSSFSIDPGGTASLGVTVTASNGSLANGRYDGQLTLSSALGGLTIPLSFFKGYGLRVDTSPGADGLAISSDQGVPQTFTTFAPSTTFYSTTPGPFTVEASWPYSYTHKHVLAQVDTNVPIAAVALDPAQAVYAITMQPVDQNGAPLSLMSFEYRFTHVVTGGGLQESNAVNGGSYPIYVSAIPAGVSFTAALVQGNPVPLVYLYEVPGPLAADRLLTNTPADLMRKEIRSFRPGVGGRPLYYVPSACIPWIPWGPASPGGAVSPGSVRSICENNAGIALTTGVAQPLYVYNSSTDDLLAAPYPEAPSMSYWVLDGSINGAELYRGPQMYPSSTHPLTFAFPVPWSGTVRANGVYALSKCDEPPGDVIPVAPGPLQDEWAWGNLRTSGALRGYKGAYENPFVWGGCVQDDDYTGTPVSYSLYHDGVLVQSATMAANFPVYPTLSDGQYRLEMTRAPMIAGVATQVETVSTFAVASAMSIDENPPALHSLHLVGRGLWQDVLDPAVVNRLRFNVDPIPGNSAANAYEAQPPLYQTLADSLASVTVQQSLDGQSWSDVPVTALGGGDYQTDTLDIDPSTALTWLRVLTADAAGNTLRTTFQIPRGASYAADDADVTPPTTTITAPANGDTITGTAAAITATAADDVGVTEVDLLLDGAKEGASVATAPPYAFTLDTRLIPSGSHTLRTRAQDAAGNVGLSPPVTVTVQNPDTSPPTVALTSPAAGTTLSGTVTIAATASDDARVVRVDLYDGSTLLGSIAAAPYSIAWNTATAGDGAHTLRAVAYDVAGNSSTATLQVTVDDTGPSVALTSPADGANVVGRITLRATASDPSGVAKVEFYVGDYGGPWATVTAPPYNTAWDTTTMAAGPVHLRARAYDTLGNWSDSTITVQVVTDTTPPTVTFTSPAEGAWVGPTALLSVTATDNVSITGITVLDGTRSIAFCATSPCAFTFNGVTLAEGPHTFTAQSRDQSYNLGTATLHVTYDQTPPTASLITPLSGAQVFGAVPLQATASDAMGLGTLAFIVDNQVVWSGTQPPFTTTWNSVTVADGAHTVAARATDLAGNTFFDNIAVFVNNTVTPTLVAPAAGALVGRTVPVTATTNNDAAVASLAFYDGTTAFATVTAPPFSVTWSPSTAGSHTLTATVVDRQGRTTTSPAVTVTTDLSPPTVALTTPANGAVLGNTGGVTVTATASDNQAVARVELYDGTTLIAAPTSAPYSATWNTAAVPLGSHTLKARAFDTAGNATDSATITVTVIVDVTAPTVSLTAPASGATVSGAVTVSANASDNVAVARVDFYDGAKLIATDTSSPYSVSWDTTAVAAGSHTLTARASDTAGNAATSAARTVTVKDVTAPTVAITSPADGAQLAVGTSVTIAATASDATGVSKVEFYVNNVLTCTDTTAPYSCAWRVPSGTGKSYSLLAKAYDAANNVRSSATVKVRSK